MKDSGVGSALRKLAAASATYGAGGVLMRGLNFALIPLYTRALTPSEYGIVALATTISAVLGVMYPLGLHGALTRTYFAGGTREERSERVGTIWIAMIGSTATMALLLNWVGPEIGRRLLPEVPFDPYLRLPVLTASLAVLGLTPLVLLQLQERPRAYVTLALGASLGTTACIVTLVVVERMGAYGYLLGAFAGALVAGVPYVWLTLRNVRPVFRWAALAPALAYSLPLIPHAFSGWALEMSDRTILARFVPLPEVGTYSLGYQLGAAMGLLIAAFNSAWVPFLFGSLERDGAASLRKLARLVTYYAWGLCFVGLGWSLLVKHAIVLVAGPAFRSAYHITPWVIAGYVCSGLYLIPVNLLFWASRTRVIALVSFAAGAVNVGLNLWLVPRVGAIGAAWSTTTAYVVMLVAAWLAARRVHPFPYEYRRIAIPAALAVALYFIAIVLPYPGTGVEILARTLLWLAFLPGLLLLRAVDRTELRALAGLLRGHGARPEGEPGSGW